jgi:enamine deaminase RidA (YjgF/YER057c/UK114 family)
MALLAILGTSVWGQPERPIRKSKEKKEPVTQALEIPPDPPNVLAGETAKLVFHVSPLSAKGLLSQQVRDALKAIDKANGGATLIKLRAFVAGTGDMRRVQAIVSEDFSEHKIQLPVVTTVQVGALPLTGAQVVLEAVSQAKNTVNPNGLAFFSALPAKDIHESVTALQKASGGTTMLRVTCFLSSLEGMNAARAEVATAFPRAAANFVQLTRLGLEPLAACEGVARADRPRGGVALLSDAMYHTPRWSFAAFVNTPKTAFSGLQMAFHDEDADVKLAFGRLSKVMETAGAQTAQIFFLQIYSLSRGIEDRALAVRDAARGAGPEIAMPPAGSALRFEGLPSLDAALGIEAIAGIP